MAIMVEAVDNTFEIGDGDFKTVKQIKVSVPYTPSEFFLDPDEAEVLMDGLESALFDSGYYEASV